MSTGKAFLNEISDLLRHYADQLVLLEEDDRANAKMQQLLQDALAKEKELRDKHDIGARFNVVRTQLENLLSELKAELAQAHPEESDSSDNNADRLPTENELIAYVYLFNAQGNQFNSWDALLKPAAIKEYSVNRPIYEKIEYVEEILRTRLPKDNHAYLEIIIEKSSILPAQKLLDQYEHPLLRLKQDALKIENLKRFFHKGKNYQLDSEGNLVLMA